MERFSKVKKKINDNINTKYSYATFKQRKLLLLISNSDAVYSFNWTSLFRLAQVKTHKYLKELQITPDSYLLWSDLATLVDIRQGSVVTCFD